MNSIKILLVDSDQTSRFFVCEALNNKNIEIVYSHSGLKAVQIFKENPCFDLVISELVLIDMDGIELIKEIRKINPDISAIAFSAYVYFNDDNVCIKEGFNCFIEKPVTLKTFIEKVSVYIDKIYVLSRK